MGNDLRSIDISIGATIARATDQHVGFIRNLTATGAMFESICDLTVGENLFLEIEGYVWVYATVIWAIGPRFGLQFNVPMVTGKHSFLRDQQLLDYLQLDQIEGKVVRPEEREVAFRRTAHG